MASNKKLQACSQADSAQSRCPLCEGPNDCKVFAKSGGSEPCWCATVTIPVDLLSCVSKKDRNRCFCSNCVLTHHQPRVSGAVRKVALMLLLLQPVALWAATFTENFSSNPAANGWQFFGNTNLFAWDSTNQTLRVTWDSSKSNSYLYRPLGTILATENDFSLSFDLTFDDYAIGVTPGKPGTFEAALGFFNFDQATKSNFFRGSGINGTFGARSLVEFDFFPAFETFNPTIAQTVVATNYSHWFFNHENQLEMTPGETFHVAMNYSASSRTLTTCITNNSEQYGQTQTITILTNDDFRLTTLSISSYNDSGQNPIYAGSILAHGSVDNVVFTIPDPPVANVTGGFLGASWRTQFASQSNWFYTLERSTNSTIWNVASATTAGNGSALSLMDTNPPSGSAYYRVRANKP